LGVGALSPFLGQRRLFGFPRCGQSPSASRC
jgi:hypothetical protein